MDFNKCGLKCLTLENVSVKLGGNDIISNCSLEAWCGKITAVIGPNGAGKTTLIRTVLKDIKYSGNVVYTDHNQNLVNNITTGYVPQKLSFDTSAPVSVTDLLCCTISKRPLFLGASKTAKIKALKMLEETDCLTLANRRLGELSGGELQRVMLTLALNPIPDLLILDEPVSGVDLNGLEIFYQTISNLRSRYHMTILLVSHDLQLVAQFADSVVLINKSVLAQGTPRHVYNCESFKNIFGSGMSASAFGDENVK